MPNRNNKWIGFWDNASSSNTNNKSIQGRGSFPDEIYYSIPNDIISTLDINSNDCIADIGGSTGDFSKYIIQKVNPTYLELFEASKYSLSIFKEWIEKNNLKNINASHCVLPEIDFKRKFNKVFVGSVFQYLNSLEDVELSIKKIYDALENNGKLLLFHHYDKDIWKPNEWDLLLINYSEISEIGRKVGFKNIKRVKIGLYHGNNICGDSELSILLTK